jgi:hypothetical protein
MQSQPLLKNSLLESESKKSRCRGKRSATNLLSLSISLACPQSWLPDCMTGSSCSMCGFNPRSPEDTRLPLRVTTARGRWNCTVRVSLCVRTRPREVCVATVEGGGAVENCRIEATSLRESLSRGVASLANVRTLLSASLPF